MRQNRYNRCNPGGYCGMYGAPPKCEQYCGDDTDCMCDMNNCGRTYEEPMPPITLAIASVPIQAWCDNVFECEDGLAHGTIFPELVMPFTGVCGR